MLCVDLKVWQVLVTSLSLENIGYLEPANFWIGPAAVRSEHTLTNTSNKKHKDMQIRFPLAFMKNKINHWSLSDTVLFYIFFVFYEHFSRP